MPSTTACPSSCAMIRRSLAPRDGSGSGAPPSWPSTPETCPPVGGVAPALLAPRRREPLVAPLGEVVHLQPPAAERGRLARRRLALAEHDLLDRRHAAQARRRRPRRRRRSSGRSRPRRPGPSRGGDRLHAVARHLGLELLEAHRRGHAARRDGALGRRLRLRARAPGSPRGCRRRAAARAPGGGRRRRAELGRGSAAGRRRRRSSSSSRTRSMGPSLLTGSRQDQARRALPAA